MLSRSTVIFALVMSVALIATAESAESEIGGPLAGVKLPLWKTQHGEPPGHPGSLPEKLAKAATVRDGQFVYTEWGPQGQAPELELYPDAVEHYRAYMFKYMPIRSFFDAQSQLRNFKAPNLPGAGPELVEQYAEPVYWVPRHASIVNTGKRRAPVPVIRCRPDAPVLRLDLGRLEPGLYAVRVIGAVETEHLKPFRRPLVIRMTINDGLDGGEQVYRVRSGYCDQFYSVAEIYFHAPETRDYKAALTVDPLSEVDLLVHNITLDDVLVGTIRRPIKERSVSVPQPIDGKSHLSESDRRDRDEAIWYSIPPINVRPSGGLFTPSGHHSHLPEEVTFGAEGMSPEEVESRYGKWERGTGKVLLVNEKLGLQYTVDDLLSGRTLPDPYPYKDSGCGVVFPNPVDPGSGRIWCPIAQIADEVYRGPRRNRPSNADEARDAAVELIRYAYQFPTIEYGALLSSVVRSPGVYGRDLSCRRRGTAAMFLDHYANYGQLAERYDQLYPYIQGNEDLARSIGRFVPWVKTSDDLVMLCDVYLLQTLAKRIMRYHYHTDPLVIARCATILGDTSITDDWMDFLFTRTFIYPLPPLGIQDAMITGCERDGCEYVASTFYAREEGASRVAEGLRDYIEHGGNPKYNLSDTARFPKPAAHERWHSRIVAAGDFLRIGDVTGPDKRPGQFGRPGPQLRSRVLPYWAAILEGGHGQTDKRFQHAAYLRTGFGLGHHHHDTMDLQIVAHGQPMTIDGGQRPGYSTPGDRATRVHNLVQVDGEANWGQSWVKALTDAEGAPYVQAEMVPPGRARLYRRQMALIDMVDREGVPSPDCYVFDVVRVSGGDEHVYCFHGLVNDDFQWNVLEEKSAADEPYLKPFSRAPETKRAGTAPAVFQATWRQIRGKVGRGFGSEEYWGVATGPRKFTRLHLFGAPGANAYVADAVCHKWGYQYTCSFVRRKGSDLESAFSAVLEPYLGDPVIASREKLPIMENETDALRAVALEVKTKSGSTDICFADGRPEKTRQAGPLAVSGEFAFYSTDDHGLRLATITGGTLLAGPEIEMRLKERERTGNVVDVDYLKRTLWLDRAWPASARDRVFEIGVPGRMTAYTASRVSPQGDRTAIEVTQGADFFRSRIVDVNADERIVRCATGPALGLKRGIDKHWVASNDDATRFWRADYLDDARFRLEGAPVRLGDFGDTRALRLWEYGAGDAVRQSTFACIRRTGEGVFELTADTDVTISLRAAVIEASRDRATWQPLNTEPDRDKVTFQIPLSLLSDNGTLFLRVKPVPDFPEVAQSENSSS